MTDEKRIDLLKSFARERFGSLRRMSLAVGKSQNYFAEYFAKGKVPPPFALRKLEHFGLPMEPFADMLLSGAMDWSDDDESTLPGSAVVGSAAVGSASHEIATHEEALPEPSARDEYEALQMYGGKPEWLDLPDEVRLRLEQRFALLQMEIEEADDVCRREIERMKMERDGKIAGVVSAFRRSMMRQLLGEKPVEGEEF